METNIGIIFFAFMITIVLIGIFMRFVLRTPNVYGEEISMHLLFGSTMIGISLGVRSKSHLGVEGLVDALPGIAGKIVKILMSFVVMGMYGALCVISFTLASQSMQFDSFTAALRVPYYSIYYTMSFLFAICLLQSIFLFINAYLLEKPILKIEGGGTLS
ncbi:MAG: TRAP transporter small permease subunit [Deltaproteobacteria bacterium]|nr:TRAP transporter small permease subunit [Deltaproteobacteria bacterium]